jgi:hypothetical protein
MKGDLVVSVYMEDVSWIPAALETNRVERAFVYNKGERDLSFPDDRISVIKVPNLGREGETFLRHISTRWDSIPERIWFCQGNPFEHSPDFLGLIGALDSYARLPFLSMSHRYKESSSIPPNEMTKINDAFCVDGFRCSPYFIRDMQVVGHCSFVDEGIRIVIREFMDKYVTPDAFGYLSQRLGIARPGPITEFAYAACFYTLGGSIRRHPRWVYEETLRFLMESNDQGAFQGFVLERFWPYLLTGRSHDSLLGCYRDVLDRGEIAVWNRRNKSLWLKGRSLEDVVECPESVTCFVKDGRVRHLPGINIVGRDRDRVGCGSLEEADSRISSFFGQHPSA